MNGSECLLRTLLAHGIDTCFMNPGTSEMQFVNALDRVPAMRGVLCLFEGVCSGAADGYARMLGRPAATLLHLGPGLGNGLSNFHNARKANSPVVNIVGQHTTGHLRLEAPLSADIEAFARPVSCHIGTAADAREIGPAAAAAIRAACAPPGGVATLIVPADVSWSEAGASQGPEPLEAAPPPSSHSLREAASLLRSGESCGLFLGGRTLLARGLAAAARLAAAGIRVFANRYSARLEAGGRRYAPPRLAYFPEAAEEMLAGLKHLILLDTLQPVSFFGYPGRRGTMAPEDCAIHAVEGDGTAALEELAAEFGCDGAPLEVDRPEPPGDVPLSPKALGLLLPSLLPEGAILSDEMVSSGEPISRYLSSAPPFDLLPVTGGSIGQGLPVALGAAIACPDRKVIALEADGSAMYTPQTLWTMAREGLDVVVVILANRRYRILDIEMRRTGAGAIGPLANRMIDLGCPDLDWVKLGGGMGVPSERVESTREFTEAFRAALARRGPALIEALLA